MSLSIPGFRPQLRSTGSVLLQHLLCMSEKAKVKGAWLHTAVCAGFSLHNLVWLCQRCTFCGHDRLWGLCTFTLSVFQTVHQLSKRVHWLVGGQPVRMGLECKILGHVGRLVSTFQFIAFLRCCFSYCIVCISKNFLRHSSCATCWNSRRTVAQLSLTAFSFRFAS